MKWISFIKTQFSNLSTNLLDKDMVPPHESFIIPTLDNTIHYIISYYIYTNRGEVTNRAEVRLHKKDIEIMD